MNTSATHLVLIPSYNPGALVYETVRAARRSGHPCGWWSTAAPMARRGLPDMAATDPGLGCSCLPPNQGQGRGGIAWHSAAAAAKGSPMR